MKKIISLIIILNLLLSCIGTLTIANTSTNQTTSTNSTNQTTISTSTKVWRIATSGIGYSVFPQFRWKYDKKTRIILISALTQEELKTLKPVNAKDYEYLNIDKAIFGPMEKTFGIDKAPIKSAILDKNTKVVSASTFNCCDELKYVANLDKVQAIDQEAFYCCMSLKGFKNKDLLELTNIKDIDSYAFVNCSSLKGIRLGKNIKEIGKQAFVGCERLEKVYLDCKRPLSYIGSHAFTSTKSGIKFYVKNKKVAKDLKKKLKHLGVKNAKIYIGKKLIYKNITDKCGF